MHRRIEIEDFIRDKIIDSKKKNIIQIKIAAEDYNRIQVEKQNITTKIEYNQNNRNGRL